MPLLLYLAALDDKVFGINGAAVYGRQGFFIVRMEELFTR